jgi:hypothetical protein
MNADSIIKLLDEVVVRISGPAERLWAIYIKQMISYGIADLIAAVMLFSVVAVMLFVIRKNKWELDMLEDGGMLNIILLTISACLAIWSGALLIHGLLFLMNPEFYALDQIIQGIK